MLSFINKKELIRELFLNSFSPLYVCAFVLSNPAKQPYMNMLGDESHSKNAFGKNNKNETF